MNCKIDHPKDVFFYYFETRNETIFYLFSVQIQLRTIKSIQKQRFLLLPYYSTFPIRVLKKAFENK